MNILDIIDNIKIKTIYGNYQIVLTAFPKIQEKSEKGMSLSLLKVIL